jgi:hypothetical protein
LVNVRWNLNPPLDVGEQIKVGLVDWSFDFSLWHPFWIFVGEFSYCYNELCFHNDTH